MIEEFTWSPRINPQGEFLYKTRKVKFGDGYEQVSGDGINSRSQKWSLNFIGNESYIQPIREFVDRHKGTCSFKWKPPLEELGLYRCDEHKLTPMGGANYSLSLTFSQAFKP